VGLVQHDVDERTVRRDMDAADAAKSAANAAPPARGATLLACAAGGMRVGYNAKSGEIA